MPLSTGVAPKHIEYPTTAHNIDRTLNPEKHCVITETVFFARKSPASNNAKPGVIRSTKDVDTNIQAVSPVEIAPAVGAMAESDVVDERVFVISATKARRRTVVFGAGGVGVSVGESPSCLSRVVVVICRYV